MNENNNELKEIIVDEERLEQFDASDEYKEYTTLGIPTDSNQYEKDARYWLNVLYNE